jgi:hypothetical protein
MYFDYVELNQKKYIQYELVDTKTIAFQTPACLMTRSEQNLMVPIVAIQAGKVIGKFNFLYLSRKRTTLIRTKLTVLVQEASCRQQMCAHAINYINLSVSSIRP